MEKTVSYLKTRRRYCVQILYKLYIVDEDLTKLKQEVLDGTQFEENSDDMSNFIMKVLDHFVEIQEAVKPLISENWTWERLPNIIKAILINGSYEITQKITSKAIVVNESIDMVREFLPSWDTAFLNAVLDKIE
ncbi:transcription antitermination protein NusB [Spiroplasma clarkii]|uniref:Transcription antitermination protein NusB n=1 Tax=Spiroplasma clarkii TaxID=2139 RepID=A0A1Y0L0Q0_9MOLU|nr:transcription antitermination factor NusB [Spiroplasma clarkii]ARU91577.1 transcription antitermination protein NusB [Spiroplasma clarkii]ATX70977.1 transcription antitermination protein NusB [Spiroplasma clarkii]